MKGTRKAKDGQNTQQKYTKDVRSMFPDGTMEVRASEKLIPLITEQIYSDPYSGWRELLSNAYQYAADAAELGAKPEIRVILDKKNNTVELHEIDSMGITLEDLRRILSNMGKSANTDSTRHGKYGMGLAAASCLSDSAVFEVCARNGDTYAMNKTDASHYELRDPPPKFEKPGMRIRLPLRADIDLVTLHDLTCRFGRFWPVRTGIRFSSGEIGRDRKETTIIGTSIKEHVLEKTTWKDKKRKDFMVEIVGDGYYLYGGYSYHGLYNDNELLIQNMPIGREPVLDLTYYTLNVYDTDKYEPAPDRERMSKKSMERLEGDLRRDLAKFVKDEAIGTIKEHQNSPHQWIYSTNPIWPEKTRTVMRILNQNVRIHGETGYNAKALVKNLLDRDVLVAVSRFEKHLIESINRKIPNATIIAPAAYEGDDFLTAGQKVTGIIDGRELVATEKFSEIYTYEGLGRQGQGFYKISEITGMFVRIPLDVLDYRTSLEDLDGMGEHIFVADSPEMQKTPAKSSEEFVATLCVDTVNTSSGKIGTREILEYDGDVCWFDRINNAGYTLADLGKIADMLLLDAGTPDLTKQRVNLARRLQSGHEIKTCGMENEKIAAAMTDGLGIRFSGVWNSTPEKAARLIGEIENAPVREVYAHLLEYRRLSPEEEGWDRLHGHMIKLDKGCAGLGKIEVLQKWVETHQRIPEREAAAIITTEAVVETCKRLALNDDVETLKLLLYPIFGEISVKRDEKWRYHWAVKYDGRPVQLYSDHIVWRIISEVGHSSDGMRSFVQDRDSTTIVF